MIGGVIILVLITVIVCFKSGNRIFISQCTPCPLVIQLSGSSNIPCLYYCHVLAETLLWTKLNTTGMILTPRAGHSTIALGKSLFVFGGFTDAQNLYDDLYMLDSGMPFYY